MSSNMIACSAAILAMVFGGGCEHPVAEPRHGSFATPEWDGRDWVKGNLHVHTTLSDGDSPPSEVVAWYRDHGYQFLVLSDHNRVPPQDTIRRLAALGVVLISGEEVSAAFGQLPVHVNGLGLTTSIAPETGTSVGLTLKRNIEAVVRAGGVPQVNHPNFGTGISLSDLVEAGDFRLLEIWNGVPWARNAGGGGLPPVEELWDGLLRYRRNVFGVAVDDAHHFKGAFSRDRLNPGRGWVSVRPKGPDATSILEAIGQGYFYSSTGIELWDIVVDGDVMELVINTRANETYETSFIGDGGVILAQRQGGRPMYRLSASVNYVRARVHSSSGDIAWTQPYFVER